MGSKSDDIKEVKWSIRSHKIQLDYIEDRDAETDDSKDPGSCDR